MREFDKIVINSGDHDGAGRYGRDGRTVLIGTKDDRTTKLFEGLLKKEVIINDLEFRIGESIVASLSGPYFVQSVNDGMHEASIVLQK
ncbi:hypothetical protein [Sporolactobacillus terrae]|uniref:Uncharacterized protein n=1 Tax=Sporolactobacillus terrae TaxID=269673 RepID=A0A5K7X1E8_9BACL|nr:hypothetical protein [Sporolactobacillus terrae]BBN98738.1 hypothetical protein St703_14430 [Sporolactobacillus terrae]